MPKNDFVRVNRSQIISGNYVINRNSKFIELIRGTNVKITAECFVNVVNFFEKNKPV